jgi:endoglycosylceramidase
VRRAALLLALAAAGCGSDPDPVDAAACSSIAVPALPDARLRAVGGELRDALDRTVILRGVNAGGRSKFAPFAPFDFEPGGYDAALAAYLDRAQSWGIDVLRVPFSWAAVEPVEGSDDEAFLARYDALLDGAWARGMRTVVDFHQDVYAEVFCGDGFPAWTVPDPKPAPHHDCPDWSAGYFGDPEVRAAFDRFWADGSPVRASFDKMWVRMATRHRDRPGVVGFEPMNEPGWGTADIEAFEATTLTAFFGDMAQKLHAVAPDALVFLDTPGPDAGAASTKLGRPPGEGLVFAPHYYQVGALSGAGGALAKAHGDLLRWGSGARALGLPLFIGEFGVVNPAPDGAAYMTAHFDALDQLGASGTQWEYSVAAEMWNAEDLSVARALGDGTGTETELAAALVRPYPRAIAGSAVAFSYDAAARSFSLRYAPRVGASDVSEIVVPARLYPKGYDVRVSGACGDSSRPGVLFVRPSEGAAEVTVDVSPR